MLGKRKRDHAAVPRQSLHEIEVDEATNTTNATDLFKQYFEAKFEPLPQEPPLPLASTADGDNSEDESQSETSDWRGFIEDDTSVEEVRVIEHTVTSDETAESRTSEGKFFMACADQMRWNLVY